MRHFDLPWIIFAVGIVAIAFFFWGLIHNRETQRADEAAEQIACEGGPPKCTFSSGRVGGFDSHWKTCACP
jgi:hypothetical protein